MLTISNYTNKDYSLYPQTDGLVETFNRTLCNMLACYVTDEPENWDKYLPFVTFVYNIAKQSTTPSINFFLRTTTDTAKRNQDKQAIQNYENLSVMYSHQWKKIQRLKRDHLFAQIRQKNYYDVGTKTTKYNIADRDIANRVDHSKSIGIFRILLMKSRKPQTKNKKLWCTLTV